jgi:O-acetyl-ADP-ribose deacetylase (regulator of RNase III)
MLICQKLIIIFFVLIKILIKIMNNIKYVIGDATYPVGEGEKYIIHVCNDIGAFGKGFVLAISKRWKEPEKLYREQKNYILGKIQMTRVEKDICVVNMIAQHDVKPTFVPFGKGFTTVPPIRYDALRECLKTVNDIAVKTGATIHAPKFGAGLAGGKWSEIEKIIKEVVTVDVTIYTLK